MRLTEEQIALIKQVGHEQLGDNVKITLFGSRASDLKRGGDIDLLFETDTCLPNRAMSICQVYASLIMKLGDRKIDVLIKDPNTKNQRIYEIAKATGIEL